MTGPAAEPSAAPPAPVAPAPPAALALLAVLPVDPAGAGEWEAADPGRGARLVVEGGLGALVWPAPGGAPDAAALVARHQEVHRALLRGTVAPAPLGVTFRGVGEVERFLTEAAPMLRAALARVEARWEFRLHADVVEAGLAEPLALDLATHVYAELRRLSASAIPFARSGPRLLNAAFLMDRDVSAAFRTRVEELGRLNPALALELTGPWPPYDFVQMHL